MRMTFTPDGETLLSVTENGKLAVIADRPARTGAAGSYVAAALSRDGAHLYALSPGTKGIRLTLSPSAWKQQACAIAGRALTAREWPDALPGAPVPTSLR